ncbi:MAG: hypothetical protein OEY20_12160 [Gemmatimonadota bacterium]|nr:hypothetical protein [Gemmatimonadota bacterium]MDH4349817.1 hypothetical protein [Gemmatimonadota bacterium]MDH5197995.1 hypothetical protein [Gemmatimonadota bacterium]
MSVKIPRIVRVCLTGTAVLLLGGECSETPDTYSPDVTPNVELQVLNFGGAIGQLVVTLPAGDPWRISPLRQSSDNPETWHLRKVELNPNNAVHLELIQNGAVTAEMTCTVHPRALELTYARVLVDGFNEDTGEFQRLVCECGFNEYGNQRNQDQCYE